MGAVFASSLYSLDVNLICSGPYNILRGWKLCYLVGIVMDDALLILFVKECHISTCISFHSE
jgi:hypothetical protein